MIATAQVAGEGMAVVLIEQGVDERVDSRGNVAHPYENVQ